MGSHELKPILDTIYRMRTECRRQPFLYPVHLVNPVTNGALVDTIIKDSQTNASPVPRTFHAQIIRIDESELVLRYEGMDKDTVLRRNNPEPLFTLKEALKPLRKAPPLTAE